MTEMLLSLFVYTLIAFAVLFSLFLSLCFFSYLCVSRPTFTFWNGGKVGLVAVAFFSIPPNFLANSAFTLCLRLCSYALKSLFFYIFRVSQSQMRL